MLGCYVIVLSCGCVDVPLRCCVVVLLCWRCDVVLSRDRAAALLCC